MNNIFEKAFFGKAYKTRDGRKAVYWASPEVTGNGKHALIVDETANGNYITCNDEGYCTTFTKNHQSDIVSEYINDEELDELAIKLIHETIDDFQDGEKVTFNLLKDLVKTGYRKALNL